MHEASGSNSSSSSDSDEDGSEEEAPEYRGEGLGGELPH